MTSLQDFPGKRKPRDISGKRQGKLTVLDQVERVDGKTYWLCACDCGNRKSIPASSIKKGTKSCGCFGKRQTKPKYPPSKKPPYYQTYQDAKSRCNNKNHKQYHRYGGRGIKFSYTSYGQFKEDLGRRPEGHSLDRINNNGNYEPGNCRWASSKEQSANTRSNLKVVIDGIERNASDWENDMNSASKISNRITFLGWSAKAAVFSRPRAGKKRCSRKNAEAYVFGKSLLELAKEVKLKNPINL